MSYTKFVKQIETIYVDENIIIVTKPSGLLSITDRFKTQASLKDILLQQYEAVYTVQKIEKECSGIIVFARNEETRKFLISQMTNNTFESIFWAFTQNKPDMNSGIIDASILNDIKKSGRMHVSKDGAPAQTKFKLLQTYGKVSLMAFSLITDRTHQIRVHSRYINCPLLVDALYSKKNNFYLSEVKRSYKSAQYEEEKPFIKRLTLHSKSIKFTMPNGEEKTFESELPKDLRALKKQLDKLV